MFLFKEAEMEFKIISFGQWMSRNVPLSLFRQTFDFDPNGPRPSLSLVWVELLDPPQSLHSWIRKIVIPLGKVLGTKPKVYYNLAWYSQVSVALDLVKALPEGIKTNCGFKEIFQPLLFKHPPNACYRFGRHGHHIRMCPLKLPTDPIEEGKKNQSKKPRKTPKC